MLCILLFSYFYTGSRPEPGLKPQAYDANTPRTGFEQGKAFIHIEKKLWFNTSLNNEKYFVCIYHTLYGFQSTIIQVLLITMPL